MDSSPDKYYSNPIINNLMKITKHYLFVIVAACFILMTTACDFHSVEVKGQMVFTCTPEFLDYFTPQMTYVNPRGDTTFYVLNRDNMTQKDILPGFPEDSIPEGVSKYWYKFDIPISTTFLGFSTSAEVKYLYNGNTNYDSKIPLDHKLDGNISSIMYHSSGVIHIIQNATSTITFTIGEKEEKPIEEQIEEIKNSIDYFQLNVSQDAKVTTETIPHD